MFQEIVINDIQGNIITTGVTLNNSQRL